MGKLVVLNIVDGDFEKGFPVFLQIATEGGPFFAEAEGQLPPAAHLREHYKNWQSPYLGLVNSLRSSARISATAQTVSTAQIKEATKQLKSSLNQWLDSWEMRSLSKTLFKNLKDESEEIRFIIKTKNPDLQRLPWHLWDDFFNHYRRAEVALSLPLRKRSIVNFRDKARILAVFGKRETFGNTNTIDTDKDWQQLQKHLPDVELIPLEEPTLEKLDEQLWEQTPDMLFFAGHSTSEEDGTTGRIDLNQKESITIGDLEPALRRAVRKGLQLAIFNSCDGLGIARELATLHIPQIIVMREPVPDEVAQKFLQRFLEAFVGERTLCRAVRRARERMYPLESKFPGATWLPIIFQNPSEGPLTGREFRRIATSKESNQAESVGQVPEKGNESQLLWLPTHIGNSSPPKPSLSRSQEVAIICSNGHLNLYDNRFCIHCGEAFNQKSICSQGHENPAGNKFCAYCGESLERPSTRIVSVTSLGSPPPMPQPLAALPGITVSGGSINSEVSYTGRSTVIGSILRQRYKITRALGGGGFGSTFIAEDMDLPSHPLCVVKKLKQMQYPEALQAARVLFHREAQVLYRLGNECSQIPRLFAHFEENGEFFLVQEFIDGHDLSEEIFPGNRLSEAQVAQLLQEILEVLTFIHDKNIIHRDIKPQNLMRRNTDGKIILIDFGVVKQISGLGVNSQGQTNVSFIVGTSGYMPSEQLNGYPKLSSDVYALGMLGIYALTGIRPQELPRDSGSCEVFWRNLAQVSDEITAILDKMVCYNFRERYQSATEVLQALEDMHRIVPANCCQSPASSKSTILSGLQSLFKNFRL